MFHSILLTFIGLFCLTGYTSEMRSVPGEYVVTFDHSAQTQSLQQLGFVPLKILKSMPSGNIALVKRSVGENRESALKALKATSGVSMAEPNYIYRLNATPSDTQIEEQWGLINKGQFDSLGRRGIDGIDIGAKRAWSIETGSKNVVVAVIDTGLDPSLKDLRDNLWINYAELNGKVGTDDDGNGYVDDIHGFDFVSMRGKLIDDNEDGHGSHCAGVIGAKGNDGFGIAGVTWNVQIMGLKFLDQEGTGTLAGAIQAIDYAVANGAHIINASWGGPERAMQMKEAIKRASEKGVLFVASAGNNGDDNGNKPIFPASFDLPNVISVAAVNNQGKLAAISNYGAQTVHVGAPGVDILGPTPLGLKAFSGTSMASPHVSGVAALLKSHFPHLSVHELRQRIISKASPSIELQGKVSSGGIVNAYFALTNIDPPSDPNDVTKWNNFFHQISTPHPYTTRYSKTFEVKVPGAKRIAVFFERFETEKMFDKLVIRDSDGHEVTTLSGKLKKGTWSPSVTGDKMTLEFRSDGNITDYGFDITKVGFR